VHLETDLENQRSGIKYSRVRNNFVVLRPLGGIYKISSKFQLLHVMFTHLGGNWVPKSKRMSHKACDVPTGVWEAALAWSFWRGSLQAHLQEQCWATQILRTARWDPGCARLAWLNAQATCSHANTASFHAGLRPQGTALSSAQS